MVTLVVEPATPAVPMFTVLVLPFAVAPEPRLAVDGGSALSGGSSGGGGAELAKGAAEGCAAPR